MTIEFQTSSHVSRMTSFDVKHCHGYIQMQGVSKSFPRLIVDFEFHVSCVERIQFPKHFRITIIDRWTRAMEQKEEKWSTLAANYISSKVKLISSNSFSFPSSINERTNVHGGGGMAVKIQVMIISLPQQSEQFKC